MLILWMIALSSYCYSEIFRPSRLSEKFVYAISIFIIQVLFVISSLGLLGFLNSPVVVGAFGIVAGAIFLYGQHRQSFNKQISTDWGRLVLGGQKIFDGLNGLYFIFFVFLFTWLVLSAYFFPPRAVDDLSYHLPMVFEHWLKGRIATVPPLIKPEYAYPQNADLFFLVPLILSGTTRWVDAVQLIFSGFGSVVLFAWLRLWRVPRARSFFISLTFFWTPVIIFQNGTCNHDVIFCVTALIILYLCTRIVHTPSFELIGLLCVMSTVFIGMKHSALFYLMAFMPILFLRRKNLLKWEFLGIFLMGATIFCFAYFRNLILFHDPLYPSSIFFKGSFETFFVGLPYKLWSFFSDKEVGTLSHGFGLIFWSFAVPSIFLTLTRLRKKIFKRWLLFYIALLTFIFMFLFLLNPRWNIEYAPRYILIMIPIGYLLLAKSSYLLNWKLFSWGVMASSLITSSLIFYFLMPHHFVHKALGDRLKGHNFNEYHYLRYAGWYVNLTQFWAEPLEELTKDTSGLSCFFASDFFWTANMYGTRLQNQLWLTQDPRPAMPDCLIYQQLEHPYKFLMDQISIEHVLLSQEYRMVVEGPASWLFIKNNILNEPKRRRNLLDYYETTFPGEIHEARKRYSRLNDRATPLLVTNRLGNGFQYLSLLGEIPNPVHFIPRQMKPYYYQRMKHHNFVWMTGL